MIARRHLMKLNWRHVGVFFLVFNPATSLAAGSISMPRIIAYDKAIVVPDKIRAECALETHMADALRDALRKSYDRIASEDSVDRNASGLVLDATIIDVYGRPGGISSGSKSLTVQGTLWKDGTEIGSFVARRLSRMSKHTCRLLHRNSEDIADDIVKWLKSPSHGARLGDAE